MNSNLVNIHNVLTELKGSKNNLAHRQNQSLQEKSKLEADNSISNPSGNGISDGLETEFSVFKTLVSNCVHLNSISN